MKQSTMVPNNSLKGKNESSRPRTGRGQRHIGLKQASSENIPEGINAKVWWFPSYFWRSPSVTLASLVSSARFMDIWKRTSQPLKHTPSVVSHRHKQTGLINERPRKVHGFQNLKLSKRFGKDSFKPRALSTLASESCVSTVYFFHFVWDHIKPVDHQNYNNPSPAAWIRRAYSKLKDPFLLSRSQSQFPIDNRFHLLW